MVDPTPSPPTEGPSPNGADKDEVSSASEQDDDDTSSSSTSSSSSSSSDSDSDSDDESSSDDVFDESLSSVTSSTGNDALGNGLVLTLAMVQELRRSTSSGNLMGDDGDKKTKAVRRNSVSSDGYLNPTKDISKVLCLVQTRSRNELPLHQRLAERSLPSPTGIFETIMRERNVEITYMASETLKQQALFVEGTEVGYSKGLLNAVGKHDMKYVRNHLRIGGNLQCRNRFGESLVHAVVRKGTAEMLDFLIKIGEVSVQVCCDGGRTPVCVTYVYDLLLSPQQLAGLTTNIFSLPASFFQLHDACWAASPDFEIVRCLLEECPDLLLVTDKRGFAPLSYIQRDSYRTWNDFLQANADILSPKGVFQGSPAPAFPLKTFHASVSSHGLHFI